MTEINYTKAKIEEIEANKYVKNYIIYYNNNRFQWNKKKMTPVQYRNHLKNI
jgi:hypothetical protein